MDDKSTIFQIVAIMMEHVVKGKLDAALDICEKLAKLIKKRIEGDTCN